MKKIYSLLSVLFLCSAMAVAQSPANRTARTIVADVLAQMPAQQQGQYDNQIKDLITTGEDGIIQLVKMLQAPGKGDNSKVEYALSAWVHTVGTGVDDKARVTASRGLQKSLDQVSERETKAFVIRLIEIVGKDEAITKLSSYLNDESLSGPAVQALAVIGSEEAGKALIKGLSGTSNRAIKQEIVLALGEMKMKGSEVAIIETLGASEGDQGLAKAAFAALGRIGSADLLPIAKKAAEGTGYKMNDLGATEAYIAIINNMIAEGNVKGAEKEAAALLKAGEKTGVMQVRQAALRAQMKANPMGAVKLLQKALKDLSSKYRASALEYASVADSNEMYGELLKVLPKSKADNKIEILNWFSTQCDVSENKRKLIAATGEAVLIAQLKDTDPNVASSASKLAAKIGGGNIIDALANMLTSKNDKIVEIGKEALMQTKGSVVPTAIAPLLASASDAGKIAGLAVIANRMSSANAGTVYGLLDSGSNDVKSAAYKTLKDIATEEDIDKLYGLLSSADATNLPSVQQAVSAAIKSQSKDKQYETIFAQMNKAGKDKQALYYPILASTGADKALGYIVDAFKKESGDNKAAAFRALVGWKGQEAAEELYAIAKDNSPFQSQAIDRYIELASNQKLTGENRRLLLTQAMQVAKTDAQRNKILTQLGRTNTYLGMLLAGKYLNDKPVQEAAAQAVMAIALSNKTMTGKEVVALLTKTSEVLNNPDAGYQRQAIAKHLGEMPKEEGFVSIFNGKDLDGWKGLVGNPISRGKMKTAELKKQQDAADAVAKKHWLAQEDGVLFFDGGGSDNADNLCTVKHYADFEMFVDWSLDPAGPEADAGVYLRGTPQVQMWDISRTNVGAEVGSGGLYNNNPNPSKPLKVADNKLGEWNTLYIKMVGDRVTVKLNGELVVDNIILDNYWDRSQPIFPKEQIELQAHGSKVYYRNIYIKELKSVEPYQLTTIEKKEGFKNLFDGTNMHQWVGNNVDYSLVDGCIALDPKGGHGGNLYTKDEYADFNLRFDFQLTPGANNGLGIRTPKEGDAAYLGMELQILDDDAPEYAQLEKYQYHGSVYGIIPAKRGYLKPTGEWNSQEVEVKGDNVMVKLNGTVILTGNLKEATKNGTLDGKNHPGLENKKGHIAFLGHGSPVKFRNIRIKEIK